jgi:hypothetical protein
MNVSWCRTRRRRFLQSLNSPQSPEKHSFFPNSIEQTAAFKTDLADKKGTPNNQGAFE